MNEPNQSPFPRVLAQSTGRPTTRQRYRRVLRMAEEARKEHTPTKPPSLDSQGAINEEPSSSVPAPEVPKIPTNSGAKQNDVKPAGLGDLPSLNDHLKLGEPVHDHELASKVFDLDHDPHSGLDPLPKPTPNQYDPFDPKLDTGETYNEAKGSSQTDVGPRTDFAPNVSGVERSEAPATEPLSTHSIRPPNVKPSVEAPSIVPTQNLPTQGQTGSYPNVELPVYVSPEAVDEAAKIIERLRLAGALPSAIQGDEDARTHLTDPPSIGAGAQQPKPFEEVSLAQVKEGQPMHLTLGG